MQAIVDVLIRILAYFYSWTGNYGLSLILLTILIKLVTWPLTQKQLESTKKMQALEPERKKLQERYKNDKEKMNQALMELWKENQVNPAAGCVPLLIQFPVLIGMFQMLRAPEKIAAAIPDFSPFFLGVNMLSDVKDLPIFIAAAAVIITGGTTFLQQFLTMSGGGDKNTKMMLYIMPLMLAYFSYTFPAGLVLYWALNSVLSVAHHFIIPPVQKGALEKK
jgi:YidC/Oxa1 family membrane protein insertase